MNHKIYDVEKYFVEIEQEKSLGTNGSWIITWNWEITIGKHDETYKGMAKEHKKGELIPWTELKSLQPLDEMIQFCKNLMSFED